jgi:hypothetical protein
MKVGGRERGGYPSWRLKCKMARMATRAGNSRAGHNNQKPHQILLRLLHIVSGPRAGLPGSVLDRFWAGFGRKPSTNGPK